MEWEDEGKGKGEWDENEKLVEITNHLSMHPGVSLPISTFPFLPSPPLPTPPPP